MRNVRILFVGLLAVLMTGCYSHRVIGYLQEPTKSNKLPQYDSVPYEPYRIRVNDEIIYRLITLDETISKMLSSGSGNVSSQYANSYRVYSDGTIDVPFLEPVHVAGLTEQEAQDTLRAAFREIIPDADVKLALYNKYFSVIGDARAGRYFIYKEKMNIFQNLRYWNLIFGRTRLSIRSTIISIRMTSFMLRERRVVSIKCRTIPDSSASSPAV